MATIAENFRSKRHEFAVEFEKQIVAAQESCPHNRIAHWDGFSQYSTMHPIRICLDCGFEETGGWWCYSLDCSHWHERNSLMSVGMLKGKEGRTVVPMSFDEIMR